MARRRTRIVLVVVLVVVLAAAGAVVVWRDPLLLPGEHTTSVYRVDEGLTADPPGFVGRLVGLCDADTRYAEADGTGLCLVLDGPLGDVPVRRRDGRVTIAAEHVAGLAALAGPETTRLVLLRFGRPVALVPVSALVTGQDAVATPLS